MGEKDWLEIWSGQNQLQKVIEMNEKTQKFGLVLLEGDAKMLIEEKYSGDSLLESYLKADLQNFTTEIRVAAKNDCVRRVVML